MNTARKMNLDFSTAIGSPKSYSTYNTLNIQRPYSHIEPVYGWKPNHLASENDIWSVYNEPYKFEVNKYEVKSESDLTCTLVQEEMNNNEVLQTLQQKIIEQLLSLREQKLTLMEQHNQVIQNKYKVQRQLNKAKKKETVRTQIQTENKNIQQKQKQKRTTSETQQSNYNQTQKRRIGIVRQHIKIHPQQLETIYKIETIQQAISQIYYQLQEFGQTKKSFIQNHEPGKIKRIKTHNQVKAKWQMKVRSLRFKKDKLITKIVNQIQQVSLRQSLLQLIKSNQQLQSIVDRHLNRSQYKIEMLRQRISRQEDGKKKILEELIEMKSKCRHLKLENEQLKKALTYFRL